MRRIGQSLTLPLGYAPALPVSLAVPCPETPGYALQAMRSVKDVVAVRYRPPGARPTTRDVVLGYVGAGIDIMQTGAHLPAGWLSDKLVNSQANRAWALQLLRQMLQLKVGASTMMPVGRLKKGGGDPAYLFIMFPTVEAAAQFCQRLDTNTLPSEFGEMLRSLLDASGLLATFCAYIPPEALEACNEKDIVPLFKAGLTEQSVINPAAPHAQV